MLGRASVVPPVGSHRDRRANRGHGLVGYEYEREAFALMHREKVTSRSRGWNACQRPALHPRSQHPSIPGSFDETIRRFTRVPPSGRPFAYTPGWFKDRFGCLPEPRTPTLPTLLECRCRIDQALFAVIMEAYVTRHKRAPTTWSKHWARIRDLQVRGLPHLCRPGRAGRLLRRPRPVRPDLPLGLPRRHLL